MRLNDRARRQILDPEPGSALERAREYGFDLTLILRAVERTPDELLEKAVQAQAMSRVISELKKGMSRG